jgi:hypothetical protein
MFPDPIIRYEVIAKYDSGERARFMKDDLEQAINAAEGLQRLPVTSKVWINRVTIEQNYEWSRS